MRNLRGTIHSEVLQAIDAVELPEVQDMIRRLGKFNLAVAVPHMHGTDGKFLPLPQEKVAVESNLKVSFIDEGDDAVREGVAVMWRWDGGVKTASACSWCIPEGPEGCHG